MFRRIFGAALAAGIGVGLIVALLQHVALVPIILTAETTKRRARRHSLLLRRLAPAHRLSPGARCCPPAASEISPWAV